MLAAVLAENRTKCRPPLPESEAAAIVANSFKQPDREGFEVRDVTALATAIRECVLAKKVPLFDKKRAASRLIRDALLSDGFLCRTADGRLYTSARPTAVSTTWVAPTFPICSPSSRG